MVIFKSIHKYLLFSFLLSVFVSCDRNNGPDTRLKIRNESAYPILYMYSISYPDTLTFKPSFCAPGDVSSFIEPYSTRSVNTKSNWEEVLNGIPSKTLMFFIYNKDTAINIYNLTGGNCDSLYKRKELILKRIDVTIDYLNINNWTIHYP